MGNAPAWVQDLKRAAVARFEEHGFPTTHDEDWKYTDVSAFRSGPVAPSAEELSRIDAERLETRLELLQIGEPRVVFVNGRFAPTLSRTGELPARVHLNILSDSSGQGWAAAQNALTTMTGDDQSPFVALNTGLFTDGAVLEFVDGETFGTPIHFVFASTNAIDRAAAYPRLLILMGSGSEGIVAETHLSTGSAPSPTDAVTEIALRPGAILSHCRFVSADEEGLHVGATEVVCDRDSSYRSLQIQTGGKLVRADLNVRFAGEGASCVLNGAYVGSGTQHLDNHTKIDHAVPHCESRQLYKGVVADSATAVFNGKVVVRPDARKTDAMQTNKNLLLSPRASVDAKPQLEILNDDVRCTHGATIGPPDEETLFYMQSRGLDIQSATGLLAYGFAAEAVRSGVTDSLRPLAEAILKAAVAAAVNSAIPA